MYSTDLDSAGSPGCWFGGHPTLPPEVDWPNYYCETLKTSIPMHFILQMNVAEIPQVLDLPTMPRSGSIFVFIDQAVAAAFKGPFEQGKGAKVIYVPDDVSNFEPRKAPDMPDLKALFKKNVKNRYLEFYDVVSQEYWDGAKEILGVTSPSGLRRCPFEFLAFDTYEKPKWDSPVRKEVRRKWGESLKLVQNALGSYGSKADKNRNSYPHQIFGAARLSNIPTSKNMNELDIQDKLPPLPDDHIQFMSIHHDDFLGFSMPNGHSIGLWTDKAGLAVGKFEDLRIWPEY